MTQRYANNASALTASNLVPGGTLVTVATGYGGLFPETPAPTDWFKVTLSNESGDMEICDCTQRQGDQFVITRAREGTSEATFPAGSRLECRLTAETLDEWVQKADPELDGDLDLRGNAVVNGEIVDVPIRGQSGRTDNQLVVPAGGQRPTIGGSPILTEANGGMPSKSIVMFFGDPINDMPAGWVLCNGLNGTPDLGTRFVAGYSTGDLDFGTIGAEGGSNDSTGPGGAGTITSDPHTLTGAESGVGGHAHWTHKAATAGGGDLLRNAVGDVNRHPTTDFTDNTFNNTVMGASSSSPDAGATNTVTQGAAQGHSHNISLVDHVHEDSLPAYTVLAYIMKL